MPFVLTMPKLSPTMEKGIIVKWHKKEGDRFKMGDVLFEVTTDKATVEHQSLDEGYLRKILIKENEEAIINQPIALFTETLHESIEAFERELEKEKPIEGSLKEEKAPLKKTEEFQAESLQPRPTTSAAFAPSPPLQNYHFAFPEEEKEGGRLLASPLVKKMAQEKGIDLATVKGSGPHGRVLSRDLDLGQPQGLVSFGHREMPKVAPGTYEEEPLTPIRKLTGERLQASKSFIPHFYLGQDIRAEALVDSQRQLKNGGIKVSFNDFVVRASALSLKQNPKVNSGFNAQNGTLIRFKTVDIAIAVSLEEGLITPIIRHADFKNLGQIAVESRRLAERARAGKLAREEYFGGSFTISNLGMFGTSEVISVINPPQAAILGVGAIEDKPVVKDGSVIAGKVMRLTLAADHRVVDGAEAANFLKTLKHFLENPALLLV